MSEFVIPYSVDLAVVRISGHELHRLQQKAAMIDYLNKALRYLDDGEGQLDYFDPADPSRPGMELADYLALRMAGETVPALPPEDEAKADPEQSTAPGTWIDDQPAQYRVCRSGVCEL